MRVNSGCLLIVLSTLGLLLFFNSNGRFKSVYREQCDLNVQEVNISNKIWQIQNTSLGTFYLFNAYLDNREYKKILPWPLTKKLYVRIVGMLDRIVSREKFYCQIWYEDEKLPVIVMTKRLFWIWNKYWDRLDTFYQPYLISCPLMDDRIPIAVSLVENKCDSATNKLRVNYKETRKKKDFVVCVKGLNFPYEDNSMRLVEWIELLNILGADKIHFYKFSVHSNTEKVLDYYLQQEKIAVTPLTLVGNVSNHPRYQNKYLLENVVKRRLQEVIPYNDCFYRYLYQYRYVVLLDTDEVIVPKKGTWLDLLESLENQVGTKSSYVARNVYFFDNLETNAAQDIPNHMHMLKHVLRAKKHLWPGVSVKGFHNTDKVLALYNHISLWCYEDCENKNIDINLAQLHHYRNDCVNFIKNCDNMKKEVAFDPILWNFKEELTTRVTQILLDLNFLGQQ